jgi:hypothetical protein
MTTLLRLFAPLSKAAPLAPDQRATSYFVPPQVCAPIRVVYRPGEAREHQWYAVYQWLHFILLHPSAGVDLVSKTFACPSGVT